jgi:hypothetical protein
MLSAQLRKTVILFVAVLHMSACGAGKQQGSPGGGAQVELQEIPGGASSGIIEVQGVSAGSFNPAYWQHNTLNWVPDARVPMFKALTTSPYQNIYAPWPIEQPDGWRMFYGGWDGSPTPNDRIYSVTTADFLTFDNRILVIDDGDFFEVNNVNVQQLPDGSLHMICTVADNDDSNWPGYFSSPDGAVWNGVLEPYEAQFSDIVDIQGYLKYDLPGFNAGNVLFRDNNSWTLYFYNNFDNGFIYRAVGASPSTVQLQGIALGTGHDPQGVVKFVVGGKSWYVMGLMSNAPQLWYSLSNDGVTFAHEQTLFTNLSTVDTSIASVGFVTQGDRILGALYGANTGTPDEVQSDNQIYARWLQKRLVLKDSSGNQSTGMSYGPDRQWFQAPASGSFTGTADVYAEDGVTLLGSGNVALTAGKSYRLIVSP